jgi:ribosomal protein S18 acetylase RimI-like enzyme
MGISSSISRLTSYYSRHGIGATIRRARLTAKRALFSSNMVLFYCDLAKQTIASANIPTSLKVERLKSYAQLSTQDLQDMTSFWNPKQANRNIRERFEQGASLWLIRSGGKLAGYGWTVQGRTIESHYFPLAQNDVHLFDFHVFPQFRGQGMNPLLVTHILRSLAGECTGRAFIEAAEWNEAQLSSLGKTPFRRLGAARKSTILHRTIVCWAEDEPLDQMQKEMDHVNRSVATAKPQEQ